MWKKIDTLGPTVDTGPRTDSTSASSSSGSNPSFVSSLEPRSTGAATSSSTASSGTALIGAAITVRGDISGGEDLFVEGQVEGTISLTSHSVTVEKSGHVKGDITAKVVEVYGSITGNIYGQDQVLVHQSGNIKGDIFAPRVSLADGAKLKGTVDMDSRSGQDQNANRNQNRAADASKNVNGNGKKDVTVSGPTGGSITTSV